MLMLSIDQNIELLSAALTVAAAIVIGITTICAIFLAPRYALKVQKKIEDNKEKKSRKLDIFKTLLATRANTISFEHVKALNMIDIEFYDEKSIRDCWNIYRDHLNSYPDKYDENKQTFWEEKRKEYLTDLLHLMSLYFWYDFDKVLLKKGAYVPMAHVNIYAEETAFRRMFLEILAGKKPLQISMVSNENAPKVNELNGALEKSSLQ